MIFIFTDSTCILCYQLSIALSKTVSKCVCIRQSPFIEYVSGLDQDHFCSPKLSYGSKTNNTLGWGGNGQSSIEMGLNCSVSFLMSSTGEIRPVGSLDM